MYGLPSEAPDTETERANEIERLEDWYKEGRKGWLRWVIEVEDGSRMAALEGARHPQGAEAKGIWAMRLTWGVRDKEKVLDQLAKCVRMEAKIDVTEREWYERSKTVSGMMGEIEPKYILDNSKYGGPPLSLVIFNQMAAVVELLARRELASKRDLDAATAKVQGEKETLWKLMKQFPRGT